MRIQCLALLLGLPGALAAQPFLYHADQDKNAQLAVTAAKDIANGALFDKELQNLDALSKLQIQRAFSFAQAQFEAGIGAFTTWKAVSEQLDRIDADLKPSGLTLSQQEAKQRLLAVETEVAALKASIAKAAKAAGGGGDVGKTIQDRLKSADDALNYAKSLPITNAKFSEAVANVQKGVETASAIYDAFAAAIEARNDTAGKLAALNGSPQSDQLQLLTIETQHFQWLAQNSARRDLESGDVIALVSAARNKLKFAGMSESDEPIETTLENLAEGAHSGNDDAARIAARRRLFLLLIALHEAAAARAQAGLPEQLADLRASQEEARYSIQASAARVHSTETDIQNAVSRLALYYQGGLKPSQVAQLLYNLSGFVSLPIIAAK